MSKKQMKNMTKFVIISLVEVDVFAIICLIANFCDKQIQDSLIVSFFSVFTGELAGMLLKKLLDNKRKKKEDNDET